MIQNFIGEATIAPPLTLRDLSKALSNPTVPELHRYIRVGRQETWRKMGLINTRFRIAQALQALASRSRPEAVATSPRATPTSGSEQWARRERQPDGDAEVSKVTRSCTATRFF